MTGRVEPSYDSADEELICEEVILPKCDQEGTNAVSAKFTSGHEATINQLLQERSKHLSKITELNNEVILLKSQLDHVLKQVKMMTTGTEVLDRMLNSQIVGKPNGIGFTHEHLKKEHHSNSHSQALEHYQKNRNKKPVKKIMFVTSSSKVSVPDKMLEHSVELSISESVKESSTLRCDFCNRPGHKKSFCFDLPGIPKQYQPRSALKKEWIPKCVF